MAIPEMARMTRGAAGMSKRDPVPVWEDIGPLEYADASVELKIRVYRVKGRYLWSDEYISVDRKSVV